MSTGSVHLFSEFMGSTVKHRTAGNKKRSGAMMPVSIQDQQLSSAMRFLTSPDLIHYERPTIGKREDGFTKPPIHPLDLLLPFNP